MCPAQKDCLSSSSFLSGLATVSVAVAGLERPAARKPRPKPASPNRQGPQQCQVSENLRDCLPITYLF
ncbi:unnamed protein product [Plutella xylostella]|uniref:(diamondback moth) hypothetical protein n=1 Tax=Plutella xylostella TaxID=51655 RepID=A0A8S4G0N9_PLUXY|nr:unnamed protein product [Plutella xylostella]